MYLSDLKEKERFDLIVFHGRGQGGGEKVSGILCELMECQGASHKKPMKYLVRKIISERFKSILYTSGPRDLPLLFVSLLLKRNFSIYVQVPYLRSLTLRKPIFSLGVCCYYIFINLCQCKVYANSSNSSFGFRNHKILLPLKSRSVKSKGLAISKRPIIYIVGRFNIELGRGSRNISGLIQIIQGLSARLKGQIELRHYGSICPHYLKELSKLNKVNFHTLGYKSNWYEEARGIFLFNSNYEGFGLAAFEASMAGNPVYVNDRFPRELKKEAPSIYFYDSVENCISMMLENFNER